MMSGPVPDWIAEVIRACRALALMVSTFSVMPVAFWHSCVIWPLSRTSDAGTKSAQRSQCTVVPCAKAGARPLAKMAAKSPVRAATAPVAESLRSLRRVMRAMNSSLCVVRNPVAHSERGSVLQASRRDLPAKCFPDATPGREYADLRRSTVPIHRHIEGFGGRDRSNARSILSGLLRCSDVGLGSTTEVPASFVHPRRPAQKGISGAVICSLLAAVPRWHKIARAAPESASNWPRSAGAKSLVPRLWAHEALDVSADHIHVCLA